MRNFPMSRSGAGGRNPPKFLDRHNILWMGGGLTLLFTGTNYHWITPSGAQLFNSNAERGPNVTITEVSQFGVSEGAGRPHSRVAIWGRRPVF